MLRNLRFCLTCLLLLCLFLRYPARKVNRSNAQPLPIMVLKREGYLEKYYKDVVTTGFKFASNDSISILVPWLYFLAIAINIPSFPKYVNYCVNRGDSSASPASQKVYGDYSGLDSFCTFLSVNFIGCLSDSLGRKPFIMFSSAGLCLSYLVALLAPSYPKLFYVSGCIDGLSSSMFSQAQAYITDRLQSAEETSKRNIESTSPSLTSPSSSTSISRDIPVAQLSDAIGRFQGLAIGVAYVIGIPLSMVLTKVGSYRAPVAVACSVCALSVLLAHIFLPESPRFLNPQQQPASLIPPASFLKQPAQAPLRTHRRPIRWAEANPLGALKMLAGRSTSLRLLSAAYFFRHLAQTGTTVVWINYLSVRFRWSHYAAGAAYTLLGLMVTVVPRLLTCV